jgi:glycosyltransferase involved in cell wall biosynthesis
MPGGEPAAPRVSVVVPHHNDAGLGACLAALGAQRADGIPFEVIVVDNGSEVLPTEACARFEGVRLLTEPTPGPGPARSRGAAGARAPVVAFVDADCLADPGWVAAIAAAFEDPGTEVVGGDIRIAPADPERMTVVEAYESVFGYRQRLYIERDRYAATANMAVRREIFEAVGPFAGIGVAEDMDWGRRATALGYRHAYVPEMRVRTPARRDFAALARKWDRHVAHFYEENRARPISPTSARLRWLGRAALVALSPLGETVRIARSDRLEGPGNRARALLGVTRLRLYRAGRMLGLALRDDPARLAGGWRKEA